MKNKKPTAEQMVKALTLSGNEIVKQVCSNIYLKKTTTIDIERHKSRGSFLTAVFNGDYDRALSRADEGSSKILAELPEKLKPADVIIVLSKEKAEAMFLNALCNGLGYFCQYGFEVDYDEKMYKKAKASMEKNKIEICGYESVYMEMLRIGGKLLFNDLEGDGENSRAITIDDVHNKVALTPFSHLSDMINETDDATTGEVMIQAVLYDGETIFG